MNEIVFFINETDDVKISIQISPIEIESSYILRRPQNFAKSSPYFLPTVHTDKSKGKILQIFLAFSEYINFK